MSRIADTFRRLLYEQWGYTGKVWVGLGAAIALAGGGLIYQQVTAGGTDTTPPTVSLTAPANGATVSGSIAVSATAADNVAVTQVDFLRDGASFASDVSSPYSVSFDTTSIVDGSHTFAAQAKDAGNNSAVSNDATVTVTNGGGGPQSCPAYPSFPDAACTGVPSGTILTAYAGPSPIVTPNTVIDSKTIGCIAVQTTGVIIRNSRITCGGGWALSSWPSGYSVTIQDSEIICSPATEGSTGMVGRNMTVLRVDFSGCENSMAVDGETNINDSYMHDMYNQGGAHADGIQFPDGADDINIIHNTIITLGPGGSSGNLAGSINADTASHTNWLIEHNKLGGGAFTVYCVAPGAGTNWIIRNNAFMNNFGVGYSTQCGDETQSGNYKFEDSTPLTLG